MLGITSTVASYFLGTDNLYCGGEAACSLLACLVSDNFGCDNLENNVDLSVSEMTADRSLCCGYLRSFLLGNTVEPA